MTKNSPTDTMAAWLETIEAGSQGGQSPPTVLPPPNSKQPLLASFQALSDSLSAAPIDVGRTIAEGGMGIIKVAEQAALGRNVVIKTLRSDFAAQAAEHVLREAWATGALEHPNIVPVHDIRSDEHGSPMIVLKRIEGQTWTKLMHDPELVLEKFGATSILDWNTDILRQVTQAIRFSHSRGILHRDLKPDNVMIGSFGEVYLVDWGIAMSLSNAESSHLPPADEASEMAGTPCYMAPEMLGGSPLDQRTDIYLLGAILFEILAGRPPHRINSLEVLMKDIRASNPDIPDDACHLLSEICRRSMHKDPNERFQTASDLGRALLEVGKHRESSAMAEVANEQLVQMEALLVEKEPNRQEVYSQFGALRLGFREALKAWPENKDAKQDHDRALVALIEYELGLSNPLAAQTLSKDLFFPKSALQERIATALETKVSEQAELENFRMDQDFAIGRRTRVFVMLILGVTWTLSPLVRYAFRFGWSLMDYGELMLGTAVYWAVTMAIWFWARDSLRKTLVNRQLSRALFIVFPVQLILLLGCMLLEIPVEYSGFFMLFLWMTLVAAVVALIDYRFWPALLVYAAGFLVSAWNVDLRYFAMAAGNFTLMSTAIFVWLPRGDDKTGGLFGMRREPETTDGRAL